MRVVVDTNVLVSGLLSAAGPPGRVVDLVLAGEVVVLFDDRILAEYGDVLARPKLRIAPGEAAAILELIEHQGLLVSAPPLSLTLPDPDDLPFLEVADAGSANALITGNARHFAPTRGSHAVSVVGPASFISTWPLAGR